MLCCSRLWNKYVQKYLAATFAQYSSCKASPTLPPSSRVSVSSSYWPINEIVCADRSFLEDIALFHVIGVSTRFIAGRVARSTRTAKFICVFELITV